MTESIHRNGCAGCEHPPNEFPPCWTDEQVSEAYARDRALLTGERLPPCARQSIPNGVWTKAPASPVSVYQFQAGVYLQVTNRRRFGSATLSAAGRSYKIPAGRTKVIGPIPPDVPWWATGALEIERGAFLDGEFVGGDLP